MSDTWKCARCLMSFIIAPPIYGSDYSAGAERCGRTAEKLRCPDCKKEFWTAFMMTAANVRVARVGMWPRP